jgi:phosphate transport system substrate-binding protein
MSPAPRHAKESHDLARRLDPFLEVFVLRNAAIAALILGLSVTATATPVYADTSLTIAGSTALLPLVKDASGVYQGAHPDVKISVSGGGSGTGINQIAAKALDIGDSDILAPSQPSLVDNRVAVIGFAVVVNPDVTVKGLTKKQIQSIFAGTVTNWNQVGGQDQKIVVINRTRGSGTRVVFEKTVIAPEKVAESGLTEDATGTVISVVKQTPGAISYAAFSGTHGQPVTELAIDGVAPADSNIIIGKYPFWSYEHMFTNGPATGEAAKFIDFVKSSSDLLKKNGFIKIGDMKVSETDR